MMASKFPPNLLIACMLWRSIVAARWLNVILMLICAAARAAVGRRRQECLCIKQITELSVFSVHCWLVGVPKRRCGDGANGNGDEINLICCWLDVTNRSAADSFTIQWANKGRIGTWTNDDSVDKTISDVPKVLRFRTLTNALRNATDIHNRLGERIVDLMVHPKRSPRPTDFRSKKERMF